MRKALLALLTLTLVAVAAVAPTVAGDLDLLGTKARLALALLIDAVATESPTTPGHAERIASVILIRDNLDQYARRLIPRLIRSYPTSADICAADTLNPSEVHCWNLVAQATVDNQVIALWGTDLSFLSASAAVQKDQIAAIQARAAEMRAASDKVAIRRLELSRQ